MPVFSAPPLPEAIDPKQESVFDPLYKTLLRKATSLVGGDDPAGSIMQTAMPTTLVAGVPPTEIGALRQAGKDLLEKIRANGLEKRALGNRPLTGAGLARIYPKGPMSALPKIESDYHPNLPVPGDIMEALTYAQQKYPRIFGHIKDIADVDSITQLHHLGEVRGTSTVLPDAYGLPSKFSKLGLNVGAKGPSAANPATVGHELLHSADNIVNTKAAIEGYDASMRLPQGYNGSAYEARANVQGERFANALKGVPNPKPSSLTSLEDELTGRYKMNPGPPEATVEPDLIDWLKGKLGFGERASRGPMYGTANGKVLKQVGGVWKLLDPEEHITAVNRLKDFGPVQTMTHPDDLALAGAPKPSSPPPALTGAKGSSGKQAAAARSTLNQSMVLDIRKQGLSGADFKTIAEQYGIKPTTVREIVRGESWNWVK